MGINLELQSIGNFVASQERLINELRNIIQEKDVEINTLKYENKVLKDLIKESGGIKNELKKAKIQGWSKGKISW